MSCDVKACIRVTRHVRDLHMRTCNTEISCVSVAM